MKTFPSLARLLLLLNLLLAACSGPPGFKSTDISGVDWGKVLTLTDHQGQPRRLADFKGKAVIVFFGYTQCPDVCPTTLLSMREVIDRLGSDARGCLPPRQRRWTRAGSLCHARPGA